MQFCWLQPEQRPSAEELHLLLRCLSAQGAAEAEEEEFEQRWRALRPRGGSAGSLAPGAGGELATASSFPLLEQFSGDDVLTVTETSCGLNFECKWEAGCGAAAFSPPGGVLSPGCPAPRLQEPCAPQGAPPGVVPVLSAHSPSVGSEYFIRLEEPTPTAGHDPDCAGCAPSSQRPGHEDSDRAAASLATEPPLDQTLPSDPRPRRSPPRDPPSPGGLLLVEDADWGVATLCPSVFGDPLGACTSGTSGSWLPHSRRAPVDWAPSCREGPSDGSHMDGCPGRKCALQTVPEPGHPLAPATPREPLLGPEPGRRPDLPCLCPAEGLVAHPWTETAVSGGLSPQTEPRCAEEAEGPAGPQLPLPSIPTPSLGGALLPPEEASAPPAPPAAPTPASSRAAKAEPAPPWEGGGSSLELGAPGSEDEDDTTEPTSGVFTDLSGDGPQAERLDSTPAARCLQKQVGTPDSLDSLDIPSSASEGGGEVGSPPAEGGSGGQPRAPDSGYDTENYESPEFVLKEAQEPGEPEASGPLAPEGEGSGPETPPPASLSEKSPCRDSAYFSDLDAEPEPPAGSEKGAGGVPAPGPEPDLGGPRSPGLRPAQPSEPGAARSPGPREVSPLPLWGASSPGPGARPPGPGQEASWPQGPAHAPPAPGPGRPRVFLLTPVPRGSEGHRPELPEAPQERTGGRGAPRAPLCLALAGLPAAPEGRLEDEEEDSEDSDESDEELRCYSVQEPSEESEEEAPPAPVVVAESQGASHLRSLLKMPGLLPAAFCGDLERKKKAVSFFDDVTVYLFDQVGGAARREGRGGRGGSGAHVTRCPDPAGEPHPGARGALPRSQGVARRLPAGQPQRPQRPAAARRLPAALAPPRG